MILHAMIGVHDRCYASLKHVSEKSRLLFQKISADPGRAQGKGAPNPPAR